MDVWCVQYVCPNDLVAGLGITGVREWSLPRTELLLLGKSSFVV